MKAKITTAFHQPTKETRHISEVKNGTNCDCTCLECNNPLIAANNGKIQEHHFKHKIASDCKGNPETGLHLLAKRIIVESNKILISSNIFFNYNTSKEEKRFENLTPDVQIFNDNDEMWLVEVVVSHYCDDSKIEKLKRLNVNCLEIDLSKTDRFISVDELRKIILHDSNARKVISRRLSQKYVLKKSKKEKDNIVNMIIGGVLVLLTLKFFLRKR